MGQFLTQISHNIQLCNLHLLDVTVICSQIFLPNNGDKMTNFYNDCEDKHLYAMARGYRQRTFLTSFMVLWKVLMKCLCCKGLCCMFSVQFIGDGAEMSLS